LSPFRYLTGRLFLTVETLLEVAVSPVVVLGWIRPLAFFGQSGVRRQNLAGVSSYGLRPARRGRQWS
jgi:hypothetical protein